jgi:hypothetical protein
MNNLELRDTLARLLADPIPCNCLVCWMRTVSLGATKPLVKKLRKKRGESLQAYMERERCTPVIPKDGAQ